MRNQKNIVTVIGTGRSGTHLLGNLINTSKDVTASIEDKTLFPLITNASIYNNRKDINKIKKLMTKRLSRCKTKIYLEKSHPFLWLADDSQIISPNLKLLGIYRDPYATIASMLKHQGVRKWCENYKNFPLPNIFLGISQENIDLYEDLTIAQRCALRWISHRNELERLKYKFSKEKYLLLKYEDILLNFHETIDRLEEFLGINNINRKFSINIESLIKWKGVLSPTQIKEIENILINTARNFHYHDTD